MTKAIFVANGKKFNTYAEARAISKVVEVEYIEGWEDPKEAEAAIKASQIHKAKLMHLNTPELCKQRLGN